MDLHWRVTFGNPKKGNDFAVIVTATHANEARLKARKIAQQRGHFGRSGTVRLLQEAA